MPRAADTYCIDTSSIIQWHVDTYPPSIFPGLVARIEELIVARRLCSPRAVRDEIRPGDDLHTWVKDQPNLFLEETADVQRRVRHIMATYHDPARPQKGISGADPFVIAMAQSTGAIVVADEHPGSNQNRKIPFVCNAEGVRCITFRGLMLAEGWQFR